MFDDIQEDQKTTFKSSLADEPDSLQIQENQNNADNLNYSDGATQQQTKPNQIFGKEEPDSEPEDIFGEIDDDTKDAGGDYINQPPDVKLSANFGKDEEEMSDLSGKKNSKVKIIIIVAIVFLAAIGSAWVAYTYFIQSSSINSGIDQTADKNILPESTNTNTQNINQNTNTSVNTNTNTAIEIIPVDTDSDGLTDDDEIKFGTNPKIADTDSDGLTDREEVIKYKTNPHNIDTDGDGYKDGDEVKNGYNPKGEGKLIDKIELP